MHRADARYNGCITHADWIESSKGTPGLSVDIENSGGDQIGHVWWLTDKTKGYFLDTMAELGFDPEQLRSGSYLQHELPSQIVGRDVTYGTKEETYKDSVQIKVSWIGARKAPSDERGIGYAVASMLGGEATSDDDIPF